MTPTQKDSTALQELIAFIENNYDWFIVHSPDYGVVPKILEKAKSLLPKERKVIEDAYDAGTNWASDSNFDSSDYFNKKFK